MICTAYAIHSLASLAHEVVWLKLLAATFGMSLAAIAVVMAVFVSGLALGSFAIASVERYGNAATVTRFGLLQAALGVWALLGSIQFQMGQLAEAEATFRHGRADAPDDRELQSWLQRCLTERVRGPSPKAIP